MTLIGHRFNKIIKLFKYLPFSFAIKQVLATGLFRMINNYGRITYAQTGEDIILEFLLQYQTKGYYIDVGCNHPIRISNTFNFYLKGWTGLCIDANTSLIKEFKALRKRDTAVEAAVSDEEKETLFYEFNSDAVSTLDENHKLEWEKNQSIKNIRKIRTQTLASIIETNIPKNQLISFLSIDVEGHDFSVLKSNNFSKYRPIVILIEIHKVNIENIKDNPIYVFMNQNQYALVNYATMNAYFMDINSFDYKQLYG